MKIKFMMFLFLAIVSSLAASVNLEDRAQDFVLETKKIDIQGYAGSFNPCLIRVNGSLLMTFRIRDPLTLATNQIGFVWLDEDFNPATPVKTLEIKTDHPELMAQAQDPRLVSVGDSIYMVFNSNIDTSFKGEARRMYVARLRIENGRFIAENPEALLNYEGADRISEKNQEKNWIPFEHKGSLLLAYSISPHLIFRPLFGQKACETVAMTKPSINWDWGIIRGGTPGMMVHGSYLAFFHSSKEMKTQHSEEKKIAHYFMGAYTYSASYPFEVTAMSPEPIVGKGFYSGPAYKTWKPLRVVFPGGFIFNDKYVWITFGKQDHEIWIVKLELAGLLKSLVPVSAIE